MSKSCSNNVSFTTSPTTMSSVAARWCWCASRRKPIGLIGSNISHGTSSKSSAEYGFSVLTHARILLFHRSAIKRRLRGRTIEKKIRSIRKYRMATGRMIVLPAYLGTLVILVVTVDPLPSYRRVVPEACPAVA
jgi:hypothetical protein